VEGISEIEAEANALRLVACWNACLDLPEPEKDIPALVQALKDMEELLVWLSESGNLKSPIEPHPYGLAVIQTNANARALLSKLQTKKG
jgi:hypothetical protein